MTHSASEIFTMQLARAAGKQANKFLYSRGLQKADREDVVSAALLWCWVNRANYSLTTTLETWFMNAVRDAYKNLKRGEVLRAAESIDTLRGDDATYNTAAAESAATALFEALMPVDREIAVLTVQGYTRAEIREQGYSKRSIDAAHSRIKKLRKLVPDHIDAKYLARLAPTGSSDDADDTLSMIDMELEQLDFAPPAGKDCPPCWRCMYFEGFMPDGKRATRLDIEDKEVREAVKNTEAHKMEIAQQVRSGL